METQKEASSFNASGFVQFAEEEGQELEPRSLILAVLMTDDEFPWNCQYANDEQAPSINWHSTPQVTEKSMFTPRFYTVEIRPPFRLRFGQLLAYERYVKRLAAELKKMDIPGVTNVRGRAKFEGM